MIDMSNISRDFMPRRRREEEEGFAPQPPAGGIPAPGGGIDPTQPFGAGGGGMPSSGMGFRWDPTGKTPPSGWQPTEEELAAKMATPEYQERLRRSQKHPLQFDLTRGQVGGQIPPPPEMPPDESLWGQYGQEGPTPQLPGEMPQAMTTGNLTGGIIPQGRGAMPPGAGGFPYPEQWQQAGDIYSQLAGGMPGMPDPGAIWGGYQQQAGDLSRELAEQAGMGMGSRYGSALQRNIADVGMRAGERFGGEMERMRMGDVAGQRQAMLGAAQGLGGLGGAYAQLPGQLAGQAMGLGGQYQQMQNIPLQAQYQEFMRTQPEYNPLLQYMGQGMQVPYGPTTYQPGTAANMYDIASQMAMYSMLNR